MSRRRPAGAFAVAAVVSSLSLVGEARASGPTGSVSYSIAPASVVEGRTRTVHLTITRSAAATASVVVPLVVVPYGTTAARGSNADFELSASSVTIPAGVASAQFDIRVIGDGIDEPSEDVMFGFSGGEVPFTIVDDDAFAVPSRIPGARASLVSADGRFILLWEWVPDRAVVEDRITGQRRPLPDRFWPVAIADDGVTLFGVASVADHGRLAVADLRTGTVTLIRDATGAPLRPDSQALWMSADASVVAFRSYASKLVAGDTNGQADVFVRTLATGATRRVNVSGSGRQNPGKTLCAAFSRRGRFVLMNVDSPALTGRVGYVVKDLVTGTLRSVPASVPTTSGPDRAGCAGISDDGRVAALDVLAPNGWIVDMAAGTAFALPARPYGVSRWGGAARPTAISPDGRYVAGVPQPLYNDQAWQSPGFVYDVAARRYVSFATGEVLWMNAGATRLIGTLEHTELLDEEDVRYWRR